jgi:hypothetical protein
MGTERRRLLLLGALVLVLAGAIYQFWPSTSAGPAATSNSQARARTAPPAASAPATPEVHLQALDAERAKPETNSRNLFRYKTKPPPPPPPVQARPVQPVAPPAPVAPSGPPPPAPITLKFIGLVETAEHTQKIAILSDGRNVPYYGREGDIIEGRYRILKIGVESIDIAYVDGRGRQTIRLTGG